MQVLVLELLHARNTSRNETLLRRDALKRRVLVAQVSLAWRVERDICEQLIAIRGHALGPAPERIIRPWRCPFSSLT